MKNANKISRNEEINRLMEKYIVIYNAKLAIEQAAVIIDRHEDCNDDQFVRELKYSVYLTQLYEKILKSLKIEIYRIMIDI